MGVLALCGLGIVGYLDYVTGKDLSFTLLYLAPISVAVWFVGPAAGLVLCCLAAASNMIVELSDGAPLGVTLWNSAVRFGVYVIFYSLLSYLREHNPSGQIRPPVRRLIAFGVGVAAVALVAAGIFQYQTPHKAPPHGVGSPAIAEGPVAELASLVQQSLRSSRPLLLGSRDPNGLSCVTISHTGDVEEVLPNNPGDLDGGPGTTMATLYYFDRQSIKSPMQDFNWHQTRLRKYLENNIDLNGPAEQVVHELTEKSAQFAEAANAWREIPTGVTSVGLSFNDDWLNYCATALDKAIAQRNLSGVKHWSAELAAAAFWLEDLLRWRGFLLKNHLAALDFQARCESLFLAAEQNHLNYMPDGTLSQFPAGVLGLNGKSNYYEVERQAERIFSMPADRFLEISDNEHWTQGSVWMPPASREVFLKLRTVLSEENQKTWDMAARAPFEHSYLVNMLFRARSADLVDDLATVLKKFDARNHQARMGELLSVLMYRGHSFAGLEWGDRFQPELKTAADEIKPTETDLEALHDAWDWTNRFYLSPAQYGVTFTLRVALEQKKLDCVRATDMIAAIFRNSGRARLGHVRWCSETGGHSVASYMDLQHDLVKPKLADGLTPPQEPETWPDCYFHGHEWPPGLENNKPPYAMELYVRGIDSYIWAQGYIVRGPNAGELTSAAIPYSTHYKEESRQKVFDGPYPE
jgi:hypothetical protein